MPSMDMGRTHYKTLWSGKWLQALQGWVSNSLLSTGRMRYVRAGRVKNLVVDVGRFEADVSEPNEETFHVIISVQTFRDNVWEQAIAAMSEEASFSAHLLNGEIPRDIEDIFEAQGVSLLPSERSDIGSECSGPNWSVPCRHVAAACIAFGDLLDEDPYLLFKLRGRNREQIIAALRELRGTNDGEKSEARAALTDMAYEPPLEECIDSYWEMGPEGTDVHIRVHGPEIRMQIIKLLGRPGFINDSSLMARLAKVYSTVSQQALKIAYEEPVNNGEKAEE